MLSSAQTRNGAKLTLDGGNDTGSKAKFRIRDSCNLDFCSVIASVRISSLAAGLRSSGIFESSDWTEVKEATLAAGSISWTPEANLTACGPLSEEVLVTFGLSLDRFFLLS